MSGGHWQACSELFGFGPTVMLATHKKVQDPSVVFQTAPHAAVE